MSTIKEYIWNGSGYVELDAGTVDGRDSLEFETADPEIQNHIKTPHASVATVNSNRADIDVIKNSGYLKGVDGIEFEDFNPVNAQFLEGNPASYFAKQSDLDINTSAIGQKVDKTQVSNPNLLINGDFQIWQRGTSFGVPNGFRLTADRWRVNNEGLSKNIIVAKEGNSFNFTVQENTANSSNIAYYFEKDFINRFVGEVLTLTVVYKNEFMDNFTVDVSWFTELDVPSFDVLSTKKISLTDGWIKKTVTFRLNSINQSANSVHMQILRGNGNIFGYHIIKNVKLELGDIATPFSPRSYAEELAMCQRYYQYIPRIRMKTSATTSLEQKIPYSLPVVMRFAPTISYTGGDSFSFIETDYSGNQILLTLLINSNSVDRTFTNVKLDAEIY